METLSAIIRGDLAPAGNKISLLAGEAFSYSLSGYQASWIDSGTSALALALADARQKAPQVKNPKVIIPGYCCPDLVAAAVYAGVRPVAVDIDIAEAGYDLRALKEAIDDNTLAVIAVNFLGIKERLDEIRQLLANTSVKLIEDNAQWFPASEGEQDFQSDYIVFTFGRGKPLSLLGGGVLFSRENLIADQLIQPLPAEVTQNLTLRSKLAAYNLLLNPHFYCFLNRAPFLQLGKTEYHRLTTIAALDTYRKALFAANLSLHKHRSGRVEQAYLQMPELIQRQQLLALNSARRKRLLRYPLLCADAVSRDSLLQRLAAAGLGASPMYQVSIDQVPGVSGLLDLAGDLKNARHFASCFLTLPIHEYVSEKHIQRIKTILAQ